ncbi:MAG: helix-hairpin-helix domain-containing protein [Desulfomonilia bacterium]|jgi:competence protein ComEA
MKNIKILLATVVFLLGVGFSLYASELAVEDMGAGALNINTASVEELKMVPFIDSQTAQNIVDFRESHGPFGSVDELLEIKGISRSLLIDLRSHLILEGDSTYNPYGTL